ncbi:MAG: indolepyruvate oxidoreductase subunit beta [Bacillota bacterium]
MSKNILLAGMGGQGLVLMTDIICDAALNADYDVKSNDVVGLSQRGGMVWGNVKIGDEVFSPNIEPSKGDFLIAMEPLEGYRWVNILSDNGKIIMNTKEINPVIIQQESEEYPNKKIDNLKEKYKIVKLNAFKKGVEFGTSKVANVILIGILAKNLNEKNINIDKEIWLDSIFKYVPKKYKDINKKAFEYGFNYEN